MKNIFYVLIITIVLPVHSQWITVNGENLHNYLPFNQFTINPYTNNIWLVNAFNATVLEPDGSFTTFGENELGTLWQSDELNFGFTPDHLFYTKELTGLYLFDNYQNQILYTDNDFQKIYYDEDTLFITRFNGHLLKYTYGIGAENTGLNAMNCAINNNELYTNRGSYFYVENGTDTPLWNESYYLQSPATGAMLFKPNTDTVFLGQTTGITLCKGGSCHDTITPFNAVNMPSGNILEIDFDADNNLWAAFGDTNDEYIALGKLEGSVWTEVYTTSNSPINFEQFFGFEFDTLGNIWVASGMDLHTIENNNSPGWLSNQEQVIQSPQLSMYPNPANDIINVQLPHSVSRAELYISDLNGKMIKEQTLDSNDITPINISKLENGIYMLRVVAEGYQWQERIIKQ